MTVLASTLGIGNPAAAQRISDNAVFYHSFRSPWNNELNPALFPGQSGWYFTTSKASVAMELPVSYNDLGLRYDPVEDVTILDVNHLIDHLYENGFHLNNTNDANLLGFGFSVKERFQMSFSAGLRTMVNTSIPLGLLKMLTHGNLNNEGHLDFGGSEIVSTQAYAYASASAALKLPIVPLTIGGRFKLLDGIAAVSLDNLMVDLVTAEDVSMMQLRTNYLVHTAGLIQGVDMDFSSLRFNDVLEQLKSFANLGYTFDLGAKFSLGPLDLSMSIVDLGPGIKWRNSPQLWKPKEQEITITFDGVDLSALMSGGTINTDFFEQWGDSLMNLIDYTTEACEYWYSIPTNMYAGASISAGKLLRAGYLFQGQWANGWINRNHGGENHFCCNNTLSAHLNLGNWLELSVANSFTYDGNHLTWLNPGAALTLSLGRTTQFFAALDYASSMYLTEVRSAHVTAGVNIVHFRKEKKKEKNYR